MTDQHCLWKKQIKEIVLLKQQAFPLLFLDSWLL